MAQTKDEVETAAKQSLRSASAPKVSARAARMGSVGRRSELEHRRSFGGSKTYSKRPLNVRG